MSIPYSPTRKVAFVSCMIIIFPALAVPAPVPSDSDEYVPRDHSQRNESEETSRQFLPNEDEHHQVEARFVKLNHFAEFGVITPLAASEGAPPGAPPSRLELSNAIAAALSNTTTPPAEPCPLSLALLSNGWQVNAFPVAALTMAGSTLVLLAGFVLYFLARQRRIRREYRSPVKLAPPHSIVPKSSVKSLKDTSSTCEFPCKSSPGKPSPLSVRTQLTAPCPSHTDPPSSSSPQSALPVFPSTPRSVPGSSSVRTTPSVTVSPDKAWKHAHPPVHDDAAYLRLDVAVLP